MCRLGNDNDHFKRRAPKIFNDAIDDLKMTTLFHAYAMCNTIFGAADCAAAVAKPGAAGKRRKKH